MRCIHMDTRVSHMGTPESASRGLARVISKALRDAGISQRDAAAKTGIPLTTLSRRLTGASPLLVTELHALASLVGVPVSRLVERSEKGGRAA